MFVMPAIVLAIEDQSDREFMEQLFLSYQRLMYFEIKNIVKDSWQTEDVLQTTLLRLINNLDTLRTLPTRKLVNYIVTASKHTALTHVRNSSRHPAVTAPDWFDIPDETSKESSPEHYVLKREEFDQLAKVWMQLDERSRYLLQSRYILNQSYSDIAVELQIKPESVRMALTRARRLALSLYKSSQ